MWNRRLSAPSAVVPAIEQRVGSLAVDVDLLEATLWLVVLSTVVLDIVTTYIGLSLGLTEGNPAMRWAIRGFGFGSFALGKVLVVGTAGLIRERHPDYGVTIALGLAVPWVVTVLVNIRTLAGL